MSKIAIDWRRASTEFVVIVKGVMIIGGPLLTRIGMPGAAAYSA